MIATVAVEGDEVDAKPPEADVKIEIVDGAFECTAGARSNRSEPPPAPNWSRRAGGSDTGAEGSKADTITSALTCLENG
jgi:hypothetical protein